MTQLPSDQSGDDLGESADIVHALNQHYRASAPLSLRARIVELAAEDTDTPINHDPSAFALPRQNWRPTRSTGRSSAEAAKGVPKKGVVGSSSLKSNALDWSMPNPTHWPEIAALPATGKRRNWSQALGLVATLALVLIVAVSALAVVLTAPHGDDDKRTELQGVAVSTPTQVSEDGQRSIYGTGPDGTAYIRVAYAECRVDRMAYETALEIAVGDNYPFTSVPPPSRIASTEGTDVGLARWLFTTLPTGGSPNEQDIGEVVATYEQYLGCENSPLRQARFLTNAGFAREVYEAPSRYLTSSAPDGMALQLLWLDEQGRLGINPHSDQPLSNQYLYDFRQLDDGRLVAMLTTDSQGLISNDVPAFYQNAGYIVFIEQDGHWLIDEQFDR